MDQIALLSPVIPELGVTVIFDHIGSPDSATAPRLQTGYKEFMALLRSGAVYTKLSGTYRFPTTPELDDYIREILRIAPDRVVWASDWPHSGGTEANPDGDRDKVQPYRKVDDQGWVEKCKAFCGHDPDLIRKIWTDNPRRLWDYKGSE
jgi:predicted TIM-barrel fold metal-dependent hydrolase